MDIDEFSKSPLWLYMTKTWNLKKPKLLISVTGGAGRLPVEERFKETFGKSLAKVATTTSNLSQNAESH
jgi:hypothetical protein